MSSSRPRSCPQCGYPGEFQRDMTTGELVCHNCGAVAEESRIVSEVSFSETSGGKAVVTGQYVSHDQTGVLGNSLYGMQAGESRHQTIEKARHRMDRIGHALRIPEHIIEGALRFFRTALANNFVKGRKSQHVLSACLYLACRLGKTDHMLMDFAELIRVNVFNIGATYLALVKNQNIRDLPIVDPTVYIQRFTAKLQFGTASKRVINDAKLLVQRMGKDWLQQGRRPAGVAAACTLLAARMNNFRRSKAEIVQVAKIAEETLQRRLDEFRDTNAGTLSVQDFRRTNIESAADPPSFTRHRELERRMSERLSRDEEAFKNGEHPSDPYLDEDMVALAKELDKEDGNQLELSMDVDLILQIPRLQVAAEELETKHKNGLGSMGHPSPSKQALAKASSVEALEPESESIKRYEPSDGSPCPSDHEESDIEASEQAAESFTQESIESSVLGRAEKFLLDFRARQKLKLEAEQEQQERQAGVSESVPAEPESLSDVDDDEIEDVLLNEEEIDLKSKVWMSINREYLLDQERKRLRREAEEAAGISRPQRKRRRPQRAKPEAGQATSAGMNAANMLKEKVHSKKINYAAVTKLFSK